MHFYPFNIGDYATATAHLEPLEDIAYRRLMDLYYSTEKPIPECLNKTARLIRMRTHSECIAIVLDEFFNLESDGYHHDRIDVELFKFHEKSDKASKSAKARWKKAKKKQKVTPSSERNANALKTHSEGNAKQEPINNKQEPVTSNQETSLKDIQASKLAESLSRIFNHWVSSMNKNQRTQFTANRKKCVAARLKDGYSEQDIITAITSCAKSPYHMGQNDTGTIYDDLTLICRNGEKLEGFINNADRSPVKQQTKQQSISDNNREAMQAFLNQGDEHGYQ
jgi:uncharacterized protein YdaU (DUF1376 family)